MKKIALFGSTGSIGTATLDVVRQYPDRFSVEVLCVNTGIELLRKQIAEFHPKIVVVRDPQKAGELRTDNIYGVTVLEGDAGLTEAARTADYDIFTGAMVGFAGLEPTIEAIKRGKRIALANKETLVVAGELVKDLCLKHHAELLPVDSEHSAIFQCLIGEHIREVEKLVLTASGGPFLNLTADELASVTVAQALNHPTWKMGSKITIDSASMMNKGLEVIEAHWLFNFPKEKIDVVIHPQSVIHSMVEFVDGSIKAQLSTPDMKIPIQLALTYPERLPAKYVNTHLPSIRNLTFFEPDYQKFRCLKLAFDVLESGGTTSCILNASNEVAVARFLKGEIGFQQIPEIISRSLDKIENRHRPDLETLIHCDQTARSFAASIV
ncbi:MAG: 1-deoxy-D-xylulose 5-phosphate reductoisomerase [Ignavibacteriales bacterium]